MVRSQGSESSVTLQPTKAAAWLEHLKHPGGHMSTAMTMHVRALWLVSAFNVRHLSMQRIVFHVSNFQSKDDGAGVLASQLAELSIRFPSFLVSP